MARRAAEASRIGLPQGEVLREGSDSVARKPASLGVRTEKTVRTRINRSGR